MARDTGPKRFVLDPVLYNQPESPIVEIERHTNHPDNREPGSISRERHFKLITRISLWRTLACRCTIVTAFVACPAQCRPETPVESEWTGSRRERDKTELRSEQERDDKEDIMLAESVVTNRSFNLLRKQNWREAMRINNQGCDTGEVMFRWARIRASIAASGVLEFAVRSSIALFVVAAKT